MNQELKVAAFMTAPRHEAVWPRNIIDAALKNAGVPLVVSGGVFYGQCMQRMFEQAIESGIELAITVDFDSVFTSNNVTELMTRAMASEHIDALAALQSRRGMPYPLLTNGEDRRIDFDGEPLEVTTAHFGLTAIKLDRLKDIPKPWFWSTPNENGEWDDGKIDEDIYFWHKWRENGRTVYVDGNVAIGHMEEMVAEFDENGKHRFTYQNDWYHKNMKAPKAEATA